MSGIQDGKHVNSKCYNEHIISRVKNDATISLFSLRKSPEKLEIGIEIWVTSEYKIYHI